MPVDAGAWCSLAAVREQLHISASDTTKDAFLTNLINRAYKILERYCSRVMKQATYVEYYDGDGSADLLVNQWPIISVASIYDDLNRVFDSGTLVPAADYVIYKERGLIRINALDLVSQGIFQRGTQNIKLTYDAGYATIPADLEDAGIQMVEHMFNRSATGGFLSGSLGSRSESYDNDQIPQAVRRTLNAYRKRGHVSYSA